MEPKDSNNSLNEASESAAVEEANVGEDDWMVEMERRTEEMRHCAQLWPLS